MPSSAQLKKMARLAARESRAWYPDPVRLAHAETLALWGTTSGLTWNNHSTGAITIVGTSAITNGSDWLIPASATGSYALTAGSSVTFTGYTTGTSTIIPAQANQDAWGRWVVEDAVAQETRAWQRMVGHHVQVQETAEQRRLREAQVRQYEAERAAARARQAEIARLGNHERNIANARAKRLLIENITPTQRATLKAHGYFDVQVNGKTYRIRWGSHGNVRLVEGGREVRSFCIQPPDTPDGDTMLAQKLMLEANETEFLRIANARELV